jgi:phosphatidylinositol alpha-mannosyltransferase
VLDGGGAGVLFRRGDAGALARALCELVADPERRAELSERGAGVAAAYDWDVLARRILAVYETVLLADGGGVLPGEDDEVLQLPGQRMLREGDAEEARRP